MPAHPHTLSAAERQQLTEVIDTLLDHEEPTSQWLGSVVEAALAAFDAQQALLANYQAVVKRLTAALAENARLRAQLARPWDQDDDRY